MFLSNKDFKSVSLKIGIAMLTFFGAFNLILAPSQMLKALIFTDGYPNITTEIIFEILLGILYLVTFILPVIIFRIIRKKETVEPIGIKKAPPKNSPLIILTSVAIVLTCAQINSFIASFFNFYDVLQSTMLPDGKMELYQILLQIFSMAIVPAICEELLFRSTVLSNLLPYGKGFAIIASAVLFGLMHQNPIQILYATAAGIVLGCVYVKTKSYWCVFLIHFFNNLLAVIQEAILSNLEESTAHLIFLLIETTLVIVGLISAIILAVKEKKKKDVYQTGAFGTVLDSTDGYIQKELSFFPIKKFFLTPTVLIFTIICIVECIAFLFIF